MRLELEATTSRIREPKDMMSAPRADIISKIWQAVSFLEEVRSDLVKQVRQSAVRDLSASSIADATQQLVFAATLLVPEDYGKRRGKGKVPPIPKVPARRVAAGNDSNGG